ncbi:MAG: MFS transporter [Pseudomonadota bacterium]
MSTETSDKNTCTNAPWLPMIIISMGQALTQLNINAIPVSIGGIVEEFSVAPTTVGTVIVVYSLAVAGFIMLGAKIGQRFGSAHTFRLASIFLLLAAVMMAFSPSIEFLFLSQFIAGLGAAMMSPSFVVLITNNYHGQQQAKALGILGGVNAVGSAAGFFLAGAVGSTLGWRYAFGVIIVFGIATVIMAFKLKPLTPNPAIKIDPLGVLVAFLSIALLSLGFNNINGWGFLMADTQAPIAPLGISPALIMIFAGFVGIQIFVAWTQRRQAAQLTPLFELSILNAPSERVAAFSLLAIVGIGNALNFLVPMYIQMVQGRSSMDTAIALIPYQAAILFAAIAVVRLYPIYSPRRIARYAFALVGIAMTMLAVFMNNEWNNLWVISGLIMVGLGQGALITLLFNVLVTATPRSLSADVGALRGAMNSIANAIGTALAGAILVGALTANIQREVEGHPLIPPALIEQVNLDRATFVSNERLIEVLRLETYASASQIDEALRINAEARLHALNIAFLFFAAIAWLMVLPSRRLPPLQSAEGEVSSTSKGEHKFTRRRSVLPRNK